MAGHRRTPLHDATVPAPPGHAQGTGDAGADRQDQGRASTLRCSEGLQALVEPAPPHRSIGLRTAKNSERGTRGARTTSPRSRTSPTSTCFDHASGAQLFHGTAKNPLEHREPSGKLDRRIRAGDHWSPCRSRRANLTGRNGRHGSASKSSQSGQAPQGMHTTTVSRRSPARPSISSRTSSARAGSGSSGAPDHPGAGAMPSPVAGPRHAIPMGSLNKAVNTDGAERMGGPLRQARWPRPGLPIRTRSS